MNICFRVDSSVQIGTGHLFRCLTLAEQLRKQQAKVSFAVRKDKGQAVQLLREKGFAVLELPVQRQDLLIEEEDAHDFTQIIQQVGMFLDWVIVDHYQLSARWERKVGSELGVRIGVIDDLANRPHHCEILLDQNFYSNLQDRYQGLVPAECIRLLGPGYVILRPEFYQLPKGVQDEQESQIKTKQRMLLFFGGSDPTDETMKALQALQDMELGEWHVDVVVGLANPKRTSIEKLCLQLGAEYHCQIDYLAELMHKATFSLGAGGVTMWERCYVGLPSLVTIIAENQRKSAEDTARMGAIKLLGWHEEVTQGDYLGAIHWALSNPVTLHQISIQGKQFFGSHQQSEHGHPFVAYILGEKRE